MDIAETLRDTEDRLFASRQLDVWERTLYYHLLRRTHVDGASSAIVSIDPLSVASGMSTTKVREVLRSLHEKGCVAIDDRSRHGHSVRVLLPTEILGPPLGVASTVIDLESLDFFTDRRYVRELLDRERGRCFYCLRELQAESCTLDHVSPQMNGADHTYRNVVAACHSCNTRKQATGAPDFLRDLYRAGTLSESELPERLAALDRLRAGHVRPSIGPAAV